jgi:VanZ family protein
VTVRSLRRGQLIDFLLWATAAGLALLTLLFSFGLSAPGAGTFALADKIGHGLMYFATFLCLLLAAVWRPGRGNGRFPTLTTAILIAVIGAGIVIEVLQEVATRSRHAELGDVVAEAVGASGALAAHAFLRHRQEARTS